MVRVFIGRHWTKTFQWRDCLRGEPPSRSKLLLATTTSLGEVLDKSTGNRVVQAIHAQQISIDGLAAVSTEAVADGQQT